jgi:hypothetical protein
MDVGLLTSSPSGRYFLPPSSPPPNEPHSGIKPWPASLEEEFRDEVVAIKHKRILMPLKRLQYINYLQNPTTLVQLALFANEIRRIMLGSVL